MSTKTERAQLTAMALDTWKDVAEILADHGEGWPHTDPTRWGPGLRGAMERARALTAACAVVGADDASDIGRLSDLYDRTRAST